MANDAILQFCEELKSKRKELDISLQQISNKTKIDIKYLEAIEEGNFDIMPSVYMRAFVKEFGVSLGFKANVVLKKYDNAVRGIVESDEAIAEAEKTEDEKPREPEQHTEPEHTYQQERPVQSYNTSESTGSNGKLLFVVVAFISIIVIGVAVYFIAFDNSEPVFITERPATEESRSDKPERFEITEEPADSVSDTLNAVKDGMFNVKITTSDVVWFRVLIDGNENKQEFQLQPNSSKDIEAKEFINVLIGNSGGVQFWLNGENLNFDGKKGETKTVIITKNGIKK